MSEFNHDHFKQHLKKIIGYLDDITNKLNTVLDSYLLVEKDNSSTSKSIERAIKHYKIKKKKK